MGMMDHGLSSYDRESGINWKDRFIQRSGKYIAGLMLSAMARPAVRCAAPAGLMSNGVGPVTCNSASRHKRCDLKGHIQ